MYRLLRVRLPEHGTGCEPAHGIQMKPSKHLRQECIPGGSQGYGALPREPRLQRIPGVPIEEFLLLLLERLALLIGSRKLWVYISLWLFLRSQLLGCLYLMGSCLGSHRQKLACRLGCGILSYFCVFGIRFRYHSAKQQHVL